MPQEIEAYGKIYEFPDGMTDAQMKEAILRDHGASTAPVVKPKTGEAAIPYAPERPKGLVSNLIAAPIHAADALITGLGNIRDNPTQANLSPATTAIGSLAGSPFGKWGSAGGAFAGSVIGQVAEQGVQGNSPNIPGIIGNAVGDAGIDFGFNLAGGAARAYLNRSPEGLVADLKAKALGRLFPLRRDPDDIAAAARHPEFRPTTGQLTGSPFAKFIEKGFGSKQLAQRQAEQAAALETSLVDLRRDITGQSAPDTRLDLGLKTQKKVLDSRAALREQENAAYRLGENIRQRNVIDVEEVVGQKESKILGPDGKPRMEYETKTRSIAPVELNRTLAMGAIEKKELENMFSESTLQNAGRYAQERYREVKRTLDELFRPMQILENGQPQEIAGLREYKTAMEARRAIGAIIHSKNSTSYNNQERLLARIYDDLGQDIENSVKNWPYGGGDMLLAHRQASHLSHKRFQVYNERLMSKVLENKKNPAVPEDVYDTAFKSRSQTQEFLRALGDDAEGKQMASTAYFEDLIKRSTDKAEGKFSPNTIINDLTDIDSPSRDLFSAAQRDRIMNFARAVRNISDKDNNVGQVALRIREGNLALRASSQIITSVATGALTSGLTGALGGATIIIGARGTAKMLMNTKNAALATRLAKVRPESPEAKFAARAIMLGLKGEQVKLQIPNVGLFDAYVNEQGKVEPVLPQ